MTGERMLAGRYRLTRRLGQGAMGVVWKARDEALGRDVAVKELLLPAGLAPEAQAMAARRALREARAAALLRHPSIVNVHDVVEEDGRPCIVMDLLPGRSLDDVLEQDGPLPPAQVAAIGLEVLAALRVAHERGILHRDVKPANLFLRDDGRAVLTDFGIASLTGDATLTETGMLVGSPAFMAPERARREGGGPESDLWSLGVTMYVLAEGRSPFRRSTLMGTLSAVLTEAPEPPRRSGPLAPVLMALMTKDPAARLTAPDSEQALRAVAAGRSVPATWPVALPPGPPSPERPTQPGLRPPRTRKPIALAAVAAVAVLAAIVLAVVLTSRDGGSQPPATASNGPGAAATTGSTAPVAPVTIPSVCSLLTQSQADRLVPDSVIQPESDIDESTKRPRKGCRWSPSPAAGSGADRSELQVTVEGEAPGASAGSTHAVFAEQRDIYAPRNGRTDPGRPFTDISDLGDEAFTVVEPAATPKASVYFRSGRLLVSVRFEKSALGPSQVRDQAVRTARLIAQALQRAS